MPKFDNNLTKIVTRVRLVIFTVLVISAEILVSIFEKPADLKSSRWKLWVHLVLRAPSMHGECVLFCSLYTWCMRLVLHASMHGECVLFCSLYAWWMRLVLQPQCMVHASCSAASMHGECVLFCSLYAWCMRLVLQPLCVVHASCSAASMKHDCVLCMYNLNNKFSKSLYIFVKNT